MLFKISLAATLLALAIIAIWLDDSFILLGIVIAAALFVYFLYLQGKVRFPESARQPPDDADEPDGRSQ